MLCHLHRIICGLTGFTNKNHLIRAALEAICFQTRDILEAMNHDCGLVLNKLNVDGKLSSNNLLMQLQSDLCGIPVCECKSHSNLEQIFIENFCFQFEPSIEIQPHWE